MQLPLFVYGTLRPGTPEFGDFLAAAVRSVREATVRGRLWLHPDGTCPLLTPGKQTVYGELVDIDPVAYPAVIRRVDAYEDYRADDERHSLYLRRRIVAELTGGAQVVCWTYLWNGEEHGGMLLRGGSWPPR